MSRDAFYLAAYDITDDRERDRVATLLEGYGFRVQFSVFQLRLTRSGLGRLERGLAALELKSGLVGIYRLAAGASPKLIGAVPEPVVAQVGDEKAYAWVV